MTDKIYDLEQEQQAMMADGNESDEVITMESMVEIN